MTRGTGLILLLGCCTLAPACGQTCYPVTDQQHRMIFETEEPEIYEAAWATSQRADFTVGSEQPGPTEVEIVVEVTNVERLMRSELLDCDEVVETTTGGTVLVGVSTSDRSISFERSAELTQFEDGTSQLWLRPGLIAPLEEAQLPEPPEGLEVIEARIEHRDDGRVVLARDIRQLGCSRCDVDQQVLGSFDQPPRHTWPDPSF